MARESLVTDAGYRPSISAESRHQQEVIGKQAPHSLIVLQKAVLMRYWRVPKQS